MMIACDAQTSILVAILLTFLAYPLFFVCFLLYILFSSFFMMIEMKIRNLKREKKYKEDKIKYKEWEKYFIETVQKDEGKYNHMRIKSRETLHE